MKKFLKVFGIILASILAFMLLLTILAKIFEDNIAKVAVKRVSKEIQAPVEIASVNFNLVRRFPLSTIEFNDLWLMNPDTLQQDTIGGLKHLYISVNTREIIRGNYVVKKVLIDGLKMHYQLNRDSISNVDFLMALVPEDTSSTESSPDSTQLAMKLESLLLRNLDVSYYDESSHTGATITIPEVSLKGDILDHYYTAETKGNIVITNLSFGDYHLELMQKASLDFNLDYQGDSVMINTFSFKTDGLGLDADGWAYAGDKIVLDTHIKNGLVDLGILSRYMPDEMKQEYGLESLAGLFQFDTHIEGEYNEQDSIMPRVNANFSFSQGALKTSEYPEIKQMAFKGSATNGHLQNNSTTSLNLESFTAQTAQSEFQLQAKVLNIDQPIYQLHSKGTVNLEEFQSFIPEEDVKSINGQVKWEVGTKGELPSEIGDDFTDYAMARTWANISLNDINVNVDDTMQVENLSADFTYRPEQLTLQHMETKLPGYELQIQNTSADLHFTGSVNDVDNMAVDLKQFHLEFDQSSLDLQASLSNLTDPDYQFDGELRLNLADLQSMVPDTLVEQMRGYVNTHISSAGYLHLDSIDSQATALAFENTSIELLCQDVNVAMVDTLLEMNDFNLNMQMRPDTISIAQLSGDYKGLAFALSQTEVINAYHSAILNQDDTLKIITDIAIGDVDYALLEPFMLETDTTTDSTESVVNYKMDVKGKLAVNSFNIKDYELDSTMTIKNLSLENIATLFRVTDSTYIADSLEFNAFGGYTLTSARYDLKPDGRTVVSIKNHIDGMNFKQVLYDMDNFGQEDFSYENISGELLSDLNAEITLYDDSIPFDKVRISGDFTLNDGAIIDFEPAEELSKFTGINELDNIQFQTLNTHLFVFKGAAWVPKTQIINTAADITIFGMQSIDPEIDEYEYHIEMNLGDVLTGKRESLMKKQAQADKEAGEEVERNGVNLYYQKYDGKISKGFDRKASMDKMLKRVRLQERFLNLIFNPHRINYSTEDLENENIEN